MLQNQVAYIKRIYIAMAGGAALWLAAGLPAQEKEKPDARDSQAKEAAELFMKAIQRQDLDAVMKMVEVPFFFHGRENIKDRKMLQARLEPLVKRDQGKVKVKVQTVYSFSEFTDNFRLKDSTRKLLNDVLEKTDRVVVFSLFTDPMVDDRTGVLVRIRDGKANVAGIIGS